MDPLLTEFSQQQWFGRLLSKVPFVRLLMPGHTDLRGTGLAKATFLIAFSTSILSVLCKAAIFKINVLNPDAKEKVVTISFGYLYEMNAMFLYLFLAPIFVFVGLRFIRTTQVALRGLAARGLLTSNPNYRPLKLPGFLNPSARFLRNAWITIRQRARRVLNTETSARTTTDPIAIVGAINRRWFKPVFLLVILLGTALIIVGTEFGPKGDYWTLAFGYVQAKAIPSYKGHALDQLGGRDVNQIPGISQGDENWKAHSTVAQIQGGAITGPEKVIYWVFIVFALGIQILFLPFVVWIFFKCLFVLRLIYQAICPTKRSQLVIALDFEDESESFGLGDLHRAYNYLVAMIFVGAAAMASVVLANVAKGSHRIVGGEGTGPVLGSVGQAITSFLPLAVFIVLGVYLFFLRLKTEEARDRVIAELDAKISKARKRRREYEARRKAVCAQTAWPDSNFKAWFGTTLPSYVFPYIFLTNKPDWAGKIYDTWVAFADFFYKVNNFAGRFINWIFGY